MPSIQTYMVPFQVQYLAVHTQFTLPTAAGVAAGVAADDVAVSAAGRGACGAGGAGGESGLAGGGAIGASMVWFATMSDSGTRQNPELQIHSPARC